MKTSLSVFDKKIRDFLEYTSLFQASQKDVSDNLLEIQEKYRSIYKLHGQRRLAQKKYDYKLGILTYYGAFENFFESLIIAYLSALQKNLTSYEALPEEIKGNHLNVSVDLISYIQKGYGKYSEISVEDVIKKLYACQSNHPDAQLNTIAFTHHSSNLRIDTMQEMCKKIAISDMKNRILHNSQYIAYITGQPSASSDNFSILTDLVERRNDISHGYDAAEDDLLGYDMLVNYGQYMMELGRALYRIFILCFAEKILCESSPCYLGSPVHIYDDSIACFEGANIDISVGHELVIVKDGQWNNLATIESIQIKGDPVQQVLAGSTDAFGVKLDVKIPTRNKDKFAFYIV